MASWLLRSCFNANIFRKGTFCSKSGAYINTRIVDIYKLEPVGSHLSVKGWVRALRKMKDNVFIDVSDGSCAKKAASFDF